MRNRCRTRGGRREQFAAVTLRSFGFVEAEVTGGGTDRGLDVVSRALAAQVKYTATPVGRPSCTSPSRG